MGRKGRERERERKEIAGKGRTGKGECERKRREAPENRLILRFLPIVLSFGASVLTLIPDLGQIFSRKCGPMVYTLSCQISS